MWLMETILCQYLKYPFQWKQFFHLLEIYFKRILYYSYWQRIFLLVETIFFHSHFFWKPLMQLEGVHFCCKKPSSLFFLLFSFQVLVRMEVTLRSNEIAFFKESFVLASGNGFLINYKLCVLIRSFFLLVNTILEIRCKPVLFHFFYS